MGEKCSEKVSGFHPSGKPLQNDISNPSTSLVSGRSYINNWLKWQLVMAWSKYVCIWNPGSDLITMKSTIVTSASMQRKWKFLRQSSFWKTGKSDVSSCYDSFLHLYLLWTIKHDDAIKKFQSAVQCYLWRGESESNCNEFTWNHNFSFTALFSSLGTCKIYVSGHLPKIQAYLHRKIASELLDQCRIY